MLNGIVSLEDIVPTIMAAAGVPNVKEQLLDGYQAGDKHFRFQVHNATAHFPAPIGFASWAR